jgi:hypothetical protein
LILVTTLLAAALIPDQVNAQGGTGLGVVLGEPTGITARFMRGGNNFQAHAAWSFSGDGALQLNGDYLRSGKIDTEPMMPFYFGLGVMVKFAKKSEMGLRFPIGLNHFFKSDPFEIFGEIVPIFRLVPDTSFKLGGGVGIRYYFNSLSGGASGGS